MRKYRSSSNLVMTRWFLAELCPFYFENNMKFSVSVYYLPTGTTHSTKTWHMDMFLECPGQVRIWSWFNDFWHFTLKIIWNLQFLFIIYSTVLHIQLKFDIWICQRNGQVKLEFGHSSMIHAGRKASFVEMRHIRSLWSVNCLVLPIYCILGQELPKKVRIWLYGKLIYESKIGIINNLESICRFFTQCSTIEIRLS
jgi:hypothetical protein